MASLSAAAAADGVQLHKEGGVAPLAPRTMTAEASHRLLQHANEVRKHANLDTLDAFLAQSGHTWIEIMISHARDSRESYIHSRTSDNDDTDTALGQAFEHRMTAELLKTPSPKKKSTAANISRFTMAGPSHTATQRDKQVLRLDSDDKENRPIVLGEESPSRAMLATTWAQEQQTAMRAKKDNESKKKHPSVDVSHASKLPESRLAGPQKPESDERDSDKHKKDKKTSAKSKKKGSSERDGTASAARHDETARTVVKKAGLEEPAITDAARAKTGSSNERSREIQQSHERSGDSLKQNSNSRTDEVTLPWGPVPPSPESLLATAPASPEKEMRTQKSSAASSAFVTAPHGPEIDKTMGQQQEENHMSPVRPRRSSAAPAEARDAIRPLESTPPPKSPSKQRLAEIAEAATQKLEASLLRLDEDDIALDEHLSIPDDDAQTAQSGRATSDPEAKTLSDDEDEGITEKVVDDASSTEKPVTAGAAGEKSAKAKSTSPEEVSGSHATAAAPKRTLSSITHAKKSMVTSAPNQTLAGTAGTRLSTSKGSFLSKSLAQVESDVRTKSSFEGAAESSKATPTAEARFDSSRKRKSSAGESRNAKEGAFINESKKAKGNSDDEQGSAREKSSASKAVAEAAEVQNTKAAAEGTPAVHRKLDSAIDTNKRVSTQPQSFREKIESFHQNKAPSNAQNQPSAGPSAGSMSTHSVGIGAKKLSSPIFSRSNSHTQLPHAAEADTATGAENTARMDLASLFKEREIVRAPLEEKSSIPRPVGGTTTPTQSPAPASRNIYPTIKQTPTRIPAPVRSANASPLRATPARKDADDTLSDSDDDVFDGTSSDGDLSLVELRQADQLTMTGSRAPSTAPRPPGSQMRTSNAITKNVTQAAGKGLFMPSGGTSREPTVTSRMLEPMPSTATKPAPLQQSTQSQQPVPPTTPHGSWGGSISLKLKGILGFGTPGGGSSANGSKAQNRAPGPSSMVRKESSGTGSNVAAKLASISSSASKKQGPPSTSQVTRKASEKEIATKASTDLKKRLREEQADGAAAASSTKGKLPIYSQANAARQAPTKATIGASKVQEAPDAKRRKTNEVPPSTGKAIAQSSSTYGKAQAAQVKQTSQITQKSATSSVVSSKAPPVLKPQPSRPQPGQSVFSDQNPFQKAQAQQQDRALAAVSKQLQQTKPQHQNTNASHTTKNSQTASTAHIELEEPDSAYSDSEDEETIRRRMQHKPWETRDGLALALEAQSTVDADMIFGIPQGAVPLDEILPAQTEGARTRRMRPRSSSATWSRDGLKQVEIDRYNERMGIQGPGVKLPTAGELATSNASRLHGASAGSTASPARSSGNHRLSAIAQSAVAQGQVSKKAERTSTQYSHFR